MTKSITRFKGEYEFLSNFYPAPVEYDGLLWPSNEHAFQAAKTQSPDERAEIRCALTAGQAKKLGRKVLIRPDWEDIKVEVMLQILRSKFTLHPELRNKLLATGDARLIEGNYWHDNFWGICSCNACRAIPAENTLGNLLMHLRRELAP